MAATTAALNPVLNFENGAATIIPINAEANAGVLFVREDELVIARHRWSFVTELNLQDFKRMLVSLQVQVREFGSLLQNTQVECHKDRSVWELCNTLQEESAITKEELSHLLQEVTELYEFAVGSELPSRKRRGLINAGGSVLKFLFGVSTEDDMSGFNKRIDKVAADSKDLVHISEIHTSVLKNLDHGVKRNTKRLSEVVIKVANATSSFKKWRLNIHSQLTLSASARILQAEFSQTRHVVGEVLQAVMLLERGQLHPTLVKPSLFLPILSGIRAQLPSGLDYLLPPTLKTLRKFYEFCHVELLAVGENIRMVITIPLKQVDETFYLYKIYPWPTAVLNNTALVIETPTNHFALSADKKSYVELTESELDRCRNYGVVQVCELNVMVYENPFITCAYALFMGLQQYSDLCVRNVVIHPQPRVVFIEDAGVWVYNVPEGLELIIVCPWLVRGTESKRQLLGVGTIFIQPGCVGHAKGFRLASSFHGKSSEIVKVNYGVILPNVSIGLSPKESLALEKLSYSREPNVDLNSNSLELVRETEELEQQLSIPELLIQAASLEHKVSLSSEDPVNPWILSGSVLPAFLISVMTLAVYQGWRFGVALWKKTRAVPPGLSLLHKEGGEGGAQQKTEAVVYDPSQELDTL